MDSFIGLQVICPKCSLPLGLDITTCSYCGMSYFWRGSSVHWVQLDPLNSEESYFSFMGNRKVIV